MKDKKAGKREELRRRKAALRAEIEALQQKIMGALTAPRVPERVMKGDALCAMRWKGAITNGTHLDHYIGHPPPERTTEGGLTKIRERLGRVLSELT